MLTWQKTSEVRPSIRIKIPNIELSGTGLFEDLLMGNALAAPGLDNNSNHHFLSGSRKSGYRKWDGVVPFKIDFNSFKENTDLVVEIGSAIKLFNEQVKPYLKWVGYRETDEYWVEFQFHETISDSYVGRVEAFKNKGHPLRVSPGSKYGNVLHEMGHAIGLGHEHQRVDRDQHYRVSKSDLKRDPVNLKVMEDWDHNGAYDEDSIMKYGGQRQKFSEGDLTTIRSIYVPHQCTHDVQGGKVYCPTGYLMCLTCYGENSNYGICYYCSLYCHEGHDLVPVPAKKGWSFYCDCGAMGHKDKCTKFSTGNVKTRQEVYSNGEKEMCYHCARKSKEKGVKVTYKGIWAFACNSDSCGCCS